MTDKAREIREKLSKATIDTNIYNKVIKDRLDFGFDSIYFRYAEVCDELAVYKAKVNHSDPIEERRNMNGRKIHFYEALEQLLMAHSEGEKRNDSNK